MIVKDMADIIGTECEVADGPWKSRRILLKQDGMGFSFHETVFEPNAELQMHYKNHVEAVYCIEGSGSIEDLESGKTWEIKPGIIYALNGHERHILRTKTATKFICVFNPPLTGKEVHGADGAYPLMD